MARLLTPAQVLARLEAAIAEAGSTSAFAREAGVARSMVAHIRHGDRPICDSVANAIGLDRVAGWQVRR